MRLTDVLVLERHEDDLGVEAVGHEVSSICEQRVVLARLQLRHRAAGLAHGHADEPLAGRQPLVLEHPPGERLGLEQQCWICRHADVALDPALLKQPLRRLLADRDELHLVEHRRDRLAIRRTLQRPRADGIARGRDPRVLREAHEAQIGLGLAVIQDAAAAEQHEVHPPELAIELLAYGLTCGEDAIDIVMTLGVVAVAREHHDLDAGNRLAQLRDRNREDRLVAGIQAAIRTDQSDHRCHLAAVPGEDAS